MCAHTVTGRPALTVRVGVDVVSPAVGVRAMKMKPIDMKRSDFLKPEDPLEQFLGKQDSDGYTTANASTSAGDGVTLEGLMKLKADMPELPKDHADVIVMLPHQVEYLRRLCAYPNSAPPQGSSFVGIEILEAPNKEEAYKLAAKLKQQYPSKKIKVCRDNDDGPLLIVTPKEQPTDERNTQTSADCSDDWASRRDSYRRRTP